MPSCSIFWCKKRSSTSNLQKDNVTFHLFPKNPRLRDVWIKVCGNHISWTPKRTSTICSVHFEEVWFITQANNKRKLKQGAFPSLNLTKEECENRPKPIGFLNTLIVNTKPSDEDGENYQSIRNYEVCVTDGPSYMSQSQDIVNNSSLLASNVVKIENSDEDSEEYHLKSTFEICVNENQSHMSHSEIIDNNISVTSNIKTEKPDEDSEENQSNGTHEASVTENQSHMSQSEISVTSNIKTEEPYVTSEENQLNGNQEASVTEEQSHTIKTEKSNYDSEDYHSSDYETSINDDQIHSEMFVDNSQLSMSNTIIPNSEVHETLKEKRLKWTLQIKNTQIKRMHSKIRYLEKKVEKLREQLNKKQKK